VWRVSFDETECAATLIFVAERWGQPTCPRREARRGEAAWKTRPVQWQPANVGGLVAAGSGSSGRRVRPAVATVGVSRRGRMTAGDDLVAGVA